MKNLLAVLGIVLLSAVSASAAPAEKPADAQSGIAVEQPEAPITSPETAPDQAPAPQGVACGPLQTTPYNYTAGGSTCQIARDSLEGMLTGIATSSCGGCGLCSKSFVYKECKVIQGGYQVGGYMKYTCNICIID